VRSGSLPRLHAVTRLLPATLSLDELLAFADPQHPLVWLRDERGCVGIGEVTRITASGADRFTSAAAQWLELLGDAVIDDAVQAPGSGPLAFGSFAFDDQSAATSSLIVPRLIIGRGAQGSWITEISLSPISESPRLPEPIATGAWHGSELPVREADPQYLDSVVRGTSEVAAGAAEKLVLARRVFGSIADSDDLRVPLSRLANRYLDCWTFAVDDLLGASPETLIRRTEGAVTARILAGTRPRCPGDADLAIRDGLIADPKEQLEHALAVHSVVDAIAPLVEDLTTDPQPFALQLPNVWHLATDLRATSKRHGTSLDLAGALHPTAAVAGTPTDVAIASIRRLEGFDRERYAGAVGWIDAVGDGEWVIALRCAAVGADAVGSRRVTAYAGGGILADSVPEREFAETVSKLRPIAEAFAPQE